MISSKLFRANLVRLFIALALCISLSVPPGFCQDTEDSQIFIAGFNAYQQRDYATTIAKMDEVLKKFPDTTLRDMALFWLARAHFKNGQPQDAARIMSQFSKEYPDSPLKGTVEDELLSLAARYDRGEKIPASEPDSREHQALKVQAEQQRLAQQKAEREGIAAAQAEQQRVAAEQAERQRIAAQQAEQARIAEAARLAALKAEQQRLAAEKAEQERMAAAQAEQQRLAAERAEQQRIAAEQAEQARSAEAARLAALKTEQQRLAAAKAEQERMAAAQAEQQRIAAQQAEQARSAEAARLAALKTEQQRLAAEKAEQERMAAAQAEEQRLAAERAKQQRIAAEQAEQARRAETARLAAQKIEQQRLATEKAEQERLAAGKAEQLRIAAEKTEKAAQAKALLREKAISQYKSVMQNYPNSKASASAAAKLRELGVSVATSPQTASSDGASSENQQVFRLEVAPFAALELSLSKVPVSHEVAKTLVLPFEITNQGNGNDSFELESGFPAEYASSFAAAATPDQAVRQTPSLAPGDTFKGIVRFTIPAASIDGLRINYPIKAVSHLMGEATQSREIHLTAAAPLLRAIVKTDKTSPLPGEKLTYRVVLLNVGTTAAQNVSLRLSFPPQLEPLDPGPTPFRQGEQTYLVIDGIGLASGQSREVPVSFRLKDDSLAGQELICRAELVDNRLKTSASFVSNAATVKAVHGLLVRSMAERIVAIPGQTVMASFVVTNSGNLREKFSIAREIKGAGDALVFHDLNRDGIKQSGEPVITEVGPLEPKEETSIAMAIQTSRDTADASEGSVRLTFTPEGDSSRSVSGVSGLLYSRPVLRLTMTSGNGRLKPGDVASFDLSITNRGSNLARVVDLQSTWPEQLEFVASEPAKSSRDNGKVLWKFKELGAGEKRTIKVSFRVKQGIGVGTNIQVSNILNYEDQLGNRY